MKFKASQRALLPRRIPADRSSLRRIVDGACKGHAPARQRLTLATEALSRIYDRPVSQIIHAIYTDELRGRVFTHDAPPQSEWNFWERFEFLC